MEELTAQTQFVQIIYEEIQMTHNELHNQPLNAKQGELNASIITLQNAVDDLEAEKLPIVVEKVHTAKSIEDMFLSRLDAPMETVQPISGKRNNPTGIIKKTGWHSPKNRWTPERKAHLIRKAEVMTIDEIIASATRFTPAAIKSMFHKLGYKLNRTTRMYEKK